MMMQGCVKEISLDAIWGFYFLSQKHLLYQPWNSAYILADIKFVCYFNAQQLYPWTTYIKTHLGYFSTLKANYSIWIMSIFLEAEK